MPEQPQEYAIVPETESRMAPGFWRNWPLPKALLYVAVGLIFFGAASEAGEWATGRLSALVLYLFVWNWLAHDRRRFPEVAADYQGLAMAIAWPIIVPIYLVQTRGWRRGLMGLLAALVIVTGSTMLGSVGLLGG